MQRTFFLLKNTESVNKEGSKRIFMMFREISKNIRKKERKKERVPVPIDRVSHEDISDSE